MQEEKVKANPEKQPFFTSIELTDWHIIRDFCSALIHWGFRGHADFAWPISSQMERHAQDYSCHPDLLYNREMYILKNFRRRAHLYLDALPDENNHVEWLSIIQHHGGPTRLIDFTHSFYVALFFAIESAGTKDACIWAINLADIDNYAPDYFGFEKSTGSVSDKMEIHSNFFNSIANKPFDKPGAVYTEPFRLNKRMSLQKGFFLIPTDIKFRAEHNLVTFWQSIPELMARTSEKKENQFDELRNKSMIRVKIPSIIHGKIWKELENMNITAETLFPGLDGFARSLKYHLTIFKQLNQ